MAGHEAHSGERKDACWTSVEKLEARDHSEGLDLAGWIILDWILNKSIGRAWAGLIQVRDKWGAVVKAVLNRRVP
jgi:hypothetical protein